MSTTDVFDLEEVPIGTPGWNGIMTTNMQKIDAAIPSRIQITLGEAVDQYDMLYQSTSDGKWYKAAADGSQQPARAMAYEAGAADASIRAYRIGKVTNANWNFTPGKNLWLSNIDGAIGHTQWGGDNKQYLGWALTATSIYLDPRYEDTLGGGDATTTTTSTTTTTTTSSSSSTTTTTTTA